MGKVLIRYQEVSLEQFLTLPPRKPALEYIDGVVETKPMPNEPHSMIQLELCNRINQFARPNRLGNCLPELRRTFGGQSYVPDVVFQLQANIPRDERGELMPGQFRVPDIHVEITSPGQSLERLRFKLEHSLANGCQIGWLIHLESKWVEVHRSGQAVLKLGQLDVLEGEPVLPGFRLPVEEIFGWLML